METISVPIVKKITFDDNRSVLNDTILSNDDELDFEIIEINFKKFLKQGSLTSDQIDEDQLDNVMIQVKKDLLELKEELESLQPINQKVQSTSMV